MLRRADRAFTVWTNDAFGRCGRGFVRPDKAWPLRAPAWQTELEGVMLRVVSHGAWAGSMFAGPDLGGRNGPRLCAKDKSAAPRSSRRAFPSRSALPARVPPPACVKPLVPDSREMRESVPDFRQMRAADTHIPGFRHQNAHMAGIRHQGFCRGSEKDARAARCRSERRVSHLFATGSAHGPDAASRGLICGRDDFLRLSDLRFLNVSRRRTAAATLRGRRCRRRVATVGGWTSFSHISPRSRP